MLDRFEDSTNRARRWVLSWIGAGLVLSLAILSLAIPLQDLTNVFDGRISPSEWLERLGRYADLVRQDPKRVIDAYRVWWHNSIQATGTPPFAMVLPVLVLLYIAGNGLYWNPYDWDSSSHGNARPATWRDLRRWARERVVPRWVVLWLVPAFLWFELRRAQNLLDSGGIVLGRYRPTRYGRAALIRSAETLSCLVLAAPGSGKTSGIMIPTILDPGNANWSMFIYDIKGELFDLTAGYRAGVGAVFRFEPKGRTGARWNPLSHEKSLPGGVRYTALIRELDARLGRLYSGPDAETAGLQARLRLLQLLREDSDWRTTLQQQPDILGTPLPIDAGQLRKELIGTKAVVHTEGFLDSILRHFRPSPAQDEARSGRLPASPDLAIAGLAIADLAVEANVIGADIENYIMRLAAGLKPDRPDAGGNKYFDDTARELLFGWMGFTVFRSFRLGIEPNFARLIDWWAEAARQGAEDIAAKGPDAGEGGPNQAALDLWIKECEVFGYPARYRQVLVSQRANAEKTLANVVSTADTALNIFKLATVRDRTATSDFALDDIRGMKGADGKSWPVTIYVVVSLEDIKSMAPILMMFTEALQSRLISQPASVAKKSRPVLFGLDEFAQIPKMDILLQGPAVGRGQKVANLLIAQSNGQIEGAYGQGGRTTLYDTTEWKVVFPLTSRQTAEEFSAMIGQRTVKQRSFGRRSFDLSQILAKDGGGGTNVNQSQAGQPLFTASDLMSTEDGGKIETNEQLVIVRGRANRPIVCKTPYYFQDELYLKHSTIQPPANAIGFCGPLAHLAPKPKSDTDIPNTEAEGLPTTAHARNDEHKSAEALKSAFAKGLDRPVVKRRSA